MRLVRLVTHGGPRMFLKVGDHIINLDRVNRVDLKRGQPTADIHFDGECSRFGGPNAEAVRQFFAGSGQLRLDGVELIDITPDQ
jgi:hypothetical protein